MSTTIEQNKDIIRRFFHAWNSRRPDAFDEIIAPDVMRYGLPGRLMPAGSSTYY